MKLIALTGGIGSGKSVVGRILTAMGYPLYDCDSRAKLLMDTSRDIKWRIAHEIAAEAVAVTNNRCYADIDRKLLSEIVFADSEKLTLLNEIMHGAVRNDITRWRAAHHGKHKVAFVESAILYSSGVDALVDEVWAVEAPIETRIARAMKRDNTSQEKIERVVAAQETESALLRSRRDDNICIVEIINDGALPLLPQLLRALQRSLAV